MVIKNDEPIIYFSLTKIIKILLKGIIANRSYGHPSLPAYL